MKVFKVPVTGNAYDNDNGLIARSNTQSYRPIPALSGPQLFFETSCFYSQSGCDVSRSNKLGEIVSLPEMEAVKTTEDTHERVRWFGTRTNLSHIKEVRVRPVFETEKSDRTFWDSSRTIYWTSKEKMDFPLVGASWKQDHGVFLHSLQVYTQSGACDNRSYKYDLEKFILAMIEEDNGPEGPRGGGLPVGIDSYLEVLRQHGDILEIIAENRDLTRSHDHGWNSRRRTSSTMLDIPKSHLATFVGGTTPKNLASFVNSYTGASKAKRDLLAKKVSAFGWSYVKTQLHKRVRLAEIRRASVRRLKFVKRIVAPMLCMAS